MKETDRRTYTKTHRQTNGTNRQSADTSTQKQRERETWGERICRQGTGGRLKD